MRTSSCSLIVLAILATSFSGCKAGGQRGVSAIRSFQTRIAQRVSRTSTSVETRSESVGRGSVECDCYACRSKRAQEVFLIESPHPGDMVPASIEEGAVIEHVVTPTVIHEQAFDSGVGNKVEPNRDIRGEIIEDVSPKNALPGDTQELDAVDEPNAFPKLEDTFEPKVEPAVESSQVVPAKAKSVFRAVSSTKIETSKKESPLPNRNMDSEPSVDFEPVIKSKKRVRKKSISAPVPVKENEVKEPSVLEPIVLRARPVENHLIYNGLPSHAPVREARLRPDNQFHLPAKSNQVYFQPLPTLLDRMPSPAPALPEEATMTPLPVPTPAAANPVSQLPVTATVIKPSEPMFKLQAVSSTGVTGLPPIASIQVPADASSVEAIRTLKAATPGQHVKQQGLAQLKILPLQPTVVQRRSDDEHVERSIRGLTVRPESPSQPKRQTIER